jgi:hypothetical protein
VTTFLLGYDASCATCARTGERIKLEVENRLTVLPLQSAEMIRHRAAALGDEAPWAPTLVRIQGDHVEAWTGWRMGPALIQALGVVGSARVLSIVGQEQDPFGSSMLRRTIGRRRFLGTVTGAAVGALALSGFSASAQAAPLRKAGQATSGNLLSGAAVDDSMLKLLESADAQLAFRDHYPAPQLLIDLKSSITAQNSSTADDLTSAMPLHVKAHVDDHRDRRTTSVAVHHPTTNRFFRVSREELSGQVVDSTAEVYEIVADGAKLRLNAISINGSGPEATDASKEGATSADQDPCGGCSGPRGPGNRTKRSRTTCVEEIDVACALTFAGCVGCGPPCIGSAGAACIFCLVTGCGSLFASGGCCSGDGATRRVCFPCTPPL